MPQAFFFPPRADITNKGEVIYKALKEIASWLSEPCDPSQMHQVLTGPSLAGAAAGFHTALHHTIVMYMQNPQPPRGQSLYRIHLCGFITHIMPCTKQVIDES